MAYEIKYYSTAKKELVYLCETYGQTFTAELTEWLKFLAAEANKKDSSASIDVLEFFDDVERLSDTSWKKQWERFCNATLLEKLRAIKVVLTKRCPPWEMRYSSAHFRLLGQIPHEVDAFYMIDHTKHQIIFARIALGDGGA